MPRETHTQNTHPVDDHKTKSEQTASVNRKGNRQPFRFEVGQSKANPQDRLSLPTKVVVADVVSPLQKSHPQPKTRNRKHKMAPYTPWSPVTPSNSCTDFWMLFSGDGYCEYEKERAKVECGCAQIKKKGAAWARGGGAELGRRGQRLVDGLWARCRDCEGKMYFWVNRIIYQCPGDVAGGKVRKHREIHRAFWADERESMARAKV